MDQDIYMQTVSDGIWEVMFTGKVDLIRTYQQHHGDLVMDDGMWLFHFREWLQGRATDVAFRTLWQGWRIDIWLLGLYGVWMDGFCRRHGLPTAAERCGK